MNYRKKKFLERLEKDLKGDDLLPQNIHKKIPLFGKKIYSLPSVKYIVLSYQVIFYIYHCFFFVFIWIFKKKPMFLVKIYNVLQRAPYYGAIIFDNKKVAWIDKIVRDLRINEEDKILLVNSLCINYKKKMIGYNNQRSMIDITFFFLLSSYLILLFTAYFCLLFYLVDFISYKFIIGVLFGLFLYISIKFLIVVYKANIFDANNIIKCKNYFYINFL